MIIRYVAARGIRIIYVSNLAMKASLDWSSAIAASAVPRSQDEDESKREGRDKEKHVRGSNN